MQLTVEESSKRSSTMRCPPWIGCAERIVPSSQPAENVLRGVASLSVRWAPVHWSSRVYEMA